MPLHARPHLDELDHLRPALDIAHRMIHTRIDKRRQVVGHLCGRRVELRAPRPSPTPRIDERSAILERLLLELLRSTGRET